MAIDNHAAIENGTATIGINNTGPGTETKEIRREIARVKFRIIIICLIAIIVSLFSSEIMASLYSSRFVEQGFSISQRFLLGFKPAVLIVFVLFTSIILAVVFKFMQPLFDYLRQGQGYRKARTALVHVPLVFAGLQVVSAFLGTLMYFIMLNWDAESGISFVWVVNMKVSSVLIGALYSAAIINLATLNLRVKLNIIKYEKNERDFFSTYREYFIFFAIIYFIIVHYGYLAYFYMTPAGAIMDIPFSTGFGSMSLFWGILLSGLLILARKEQLGRLRQLTGKMEEFGTGQVDLTGRIIILTFDEIGNMAHAVNSFMEVLQRDMQAVKASTEKLLHHASSLLSSSTSLSSNTDRQATESKKIVDNLKDFTKQMQNIDDKVGEERSIIEQNLTLMEKQTVEMGNIAHYAQELEKATKENLKSAQEGSQVIKMTMDAHIGMNENLKKISSSIVEAGKGTKEIDELLAKIDTIAEKTNVLAVNATIEAANAGAAGKGFAIVAGEVRSLSNLTAEAVRSISEIMNRIRVHVEDGSSVAKEVEKEVVSNNRQFKRSQEVLDVIINNMTHGARKIEEISGITGQQLERLQDLAQDSQSLNDFSKEISETLSCLASGAENLVNTFAMMSNANEDNAQSSEKLFLLAKDLESLGVRLEEVIRQFIIN